MPSSSTTSPDAPATRGKTRIVLCRRHSGALFGVPIVAEKVRMLFDERSIDTAYCQSRAEGHRRRCASAPPSPRPTALFRDRSTTTSTSSRPSARPTSCANRARLGRPAGPTRAGSRSTCRIDAAPPRYPRRLRAGRRGRRAQGQDRGERQVAGPVVEDHLRRPHIAGGSVRRPCLRRLHVLSADHPGRPGDADRVRLRQQPRARSPA